MPNTSACHAGPGVQSPNTPPRHEGSTFNAAPRCDWSACHHTLAVKASARYEHCANQKHALHTTAHVRGPPAKSALMHLLTLPGRHISLAIRCFYLQVAQDKLHALTALGGNLLAHTVQGTDDQASLYHELHVEMPLASASAEEFLLPYTAMERPRVCIRLVESTLSSLCTRVSSRSSSTSRSNSSSKCASSDSSPRRAPGGTAQPARAASSSVWRLRAGLMAALLLGALPLRPQGRVLRRAVARTIRALAGVRTEPTAFWLLVRVSARDSWCPPRAGPAIGSVLRALRSGLCSSLLRGRHSGTSSSKAWEMSSFSPTHNTWELHSTQFLNSLTRSTL
mmetsp:Transcript_82731/g.266717  ORF Transcript_82731/g.266717 Transcript_82731/m.266717 type:complete len:338 (-) Transcript_82731:64-1077(-)